MDIGKPQRVKEVREAPVPYKGVPVPSPQKVPQKTEVRV